MKSEVAKWIDSWPLWERQVAQGLLSQELTQPLWENDGEDSDEQREREQIVTVRASEGATSDGADSERQGRGK